MMIAIFAAIILIAFANEILNRGMSQKNTEQP